MAQMSPLYELGTCQLPFSTSREEVKNCSDETRHITISDTTSEARLTLRLDLTQPERALNRRKVPVHTALPGCHSEQLPVHVARTLEP